MLKRFGIVLGIVGIISGYIFASMALAKLILYLTDSKESLWAITFTFGILGVPLIIGAIISAILIGILVLLTWIITGEYFSTEDGLWILVCNCFKAFKGEADKDYIEALKELDEEFEGAEND